MRAYAFARGIRRSSDSLARGLPRVVSTLLVLGLLGGTAAAFAVTERLKLVPSPIVAPRVTEAFSPVCRCATDEAVFSFGLRDPDRLTVTIVDGESRPVRTLVESTPFRAGRVTFHWDGRGVREGTYRARVHLANARRTIEIPNPARLDTTPPELTVQSVAPRVFSPDRDRNSDFVRIRFSLSERARVILIVEGEEVLESTARLRSKIEWRGSRLPPDTYVLRIVAEDLAGNRSAAQRAVVQLRFIELAPRRIVVPAGARFGVRVSTDTPRYRWRLGARTGFSSAETLVLPAPERPGRYTLRVSYSRYADAIPVFVRAR